MIALNLTAMNSSISGRIELEIPHILKENGEKRKHGKDRTRVEKEFLSICLSVYLS